LQIVTGLTTLIGVITELNTAFIKHTNDLANEGGANINSLSSVSITHFLSTAGKAVTGAGLASDLVKVKRKRVKKEKDPNAPKRPLTAFFLYSTFARPEVKDELGDVSPVEINNEILRRWKEMPPLEKQVSRCPAFFTFSAQTSDQSLTINRHGKTGTKTIINSTNRKSQPTKPGLVLIPKPLPEPMEMARKVTRRLKRTPERK
jgi:hypothetical protein